MRRRPDGRHLDARARTSRRAAAAFPVARARARLVSPDARGATAAAADRRGAPRADTEDERRTAAPGQAARRPARQDVRRQRAGRVDAAVRQPVPPDVRQSPAAQWSAVPAAPPTAGFLQCAAAMSGARNGPRAARPVRRRAARDARPLPAPRSAARLLVRRSRTRTVPAIRSPPALPDRRLGVLLRSRGCVRIAERFVERRRRFGRGGPRRFNRLVN